MPGQASFAEAAGLVIGGGTAYEGLVDRGRLQPGETVLITAAAGGVGSAAVQIAAAIGARPLGVASPPNRDYLESLGASEVFDYHAVGWAQQVRAAVPGGVDLLLDGAGGQTRDQALGAVRDGGRAIFPVLQSTPAQLERGITGESFAAHADRPRLEQLGRLVDAGQLRRQVGAVLPLEQVREALARVAGRAAPSGRDPCSRPGTNPARPAAHRIPLTPPFHAATSRQAGPVRAGHPATAAARNCRNSAMRHAPARGP